MLEVTNLHASYGETNVLHGVGFDVQAGEVVTLIGRNGVGKTTTLKAIIGEMRQRSGQVRFKGTDMLPLGPERTARAGIGYVAEDRGIFATLSVIENLTISPVRGPAAWPLERIFELFPVLHKRSHQKASTLSGGEQQMLAIARPLHMGSQLILLDEPTEGLAPVIVDRIGDVILQLKADGRTVLLVEQNLRFAISVADRHNLMVDGKIIQTLSNADVIEREHELLEHLGV
ncbi:Branched-chain amino acid transport ATP-binding protein LivF (TC 3.A.1.4.1) [Caballeronia glathei]|jgi:branched-chain amino acid transport system ATP-binding protein|uniref:Histidinol dehydrogenase n=1 Tax=Caballeronia glathei TaxID=60547 RepID=A0A069PVA4_9BURK|nr:MULTISPECIES: ABC transporter ATP-binding protein [Burkholderiaceae]KDR41261.1 histidinol dehydrogenase [Caballeronia glathei]TCK39384.1 amino acid/amide ABC transporter ATP-binding protein 2 (HAAT family) [Paraburkholderia sp. BL8N3]CDY78524.1 Branched-chain amino acid transport ATP-binding protein LivF (TC 3.A.1.4.1) [Caballeronia glathei]